LSALGALRRVRGEIAKYLYTSTSRVSYYGFCTVQMYPSSQVLAAEDSGNLLNMIYRHSDKKERWSEPPPNVHNPSFSLQDKD
jgi:hypothetical protein